MSLKNSPPAIRDAAKADAALLSAIHQESFTTYWNTESFHSFFSVDRTYALLAGEEGMIVWRVAAEQADILTLAVRPAFRRRGIAEALLSEALRRMEAHGTRKLFLDVEDGNVAALTLYEKHGFAQVRRRKNYYRQKDGTCTDALVLAKKLR